MANRQKEVWELVKAAKRQGWRATIWIRMEGTLMEFVFTASIKGLGAREVYEKNSFALLDAFADAYPESGPAVGADLATGLLEVTFSAVGRSLDEAAAKARQIFDAAASASGLDPIEVVGFELEAELTQRAS